MLVRYVPDRAGLRALLRDPSLDSVLLSHAEGVADRARQTAPVDSGAYRNSITARVVPGRTVRRAAEAVAEVPYAMIVESRTRNMGGAVG